MVRAAQRKRPPLSHLKSIFPAENYVGIQLKIYGDSYKYQAEFKLPATGKNLHVGSYYSLAAACLAVNLMSYLVHGGDGGGAGIWNRPPELSTAVVPPEDFLRSVGANIPSLRCLLRDSATAPSVAQALRKDLIKQYVRLHFSGQDNPRDPPRISSHILAHLHSIRHRKESRIQSRSTLSAAAGGSSDRPSSSAADAPSPRSASQSFASFPAAHLPSSSASVPANHSLDPNAAALLPPSPSPSAGIRNDYGVVPPSHWPILDASQEAIRQWPAAVRPLTSSAGADGDDNEIDDDDGGDGGNPIDDFVQLDPDFDIIMGAAAPPAFAAGQMQGSGDIVAGNMQASTSTAGALPERLQVRSESHHRLDQNLVGEMEGTSSYAPFTQPVMMASSPTTSTYPYGQLEQGRAYGSMIMTRTEGDNRRRSRYHSPVGRPSMDNNRYRAAAAERPSTAAAGQHWVRRVGSSRSWGADEATSATVAPSECREALDGEVPIVSHNSYSVNGENASAVVMVGGGCAMLEGRFTCTNISYGVGSNHIVGGRAVIETGPRPGSPGRGGYDRVGEETTELASLLEPHIPPPFTHP